MRWRKLGQVFDPTAFQLPGDGREFAQAPQVLLLGDLIRVYFSTRERDRTGKYLSHIAFADFDKRFNVVGVSSEPVLGLGKLGCYDEHGVFPLNVVPTADGLLGYIGGWSRRVSVSVDGAIGLARSDDGGRTFQRLGDGPVLCASSGEPFLIGDPFVQLHDGVFHMWYLYGVHWKRYAPDAPPDRLYKIGHAVSPDGVAWTREEARRVVADRLGPDESQALPTVFTIGGRHHMLFCYRQSFDFRVNSERGYRIGHAFSDDLCDWTRDDSELGLDVSPGSWDSEMVCYPHAFALDGDVYVLYNGNQFGRFGFGLARLEQ
jgi:hypothetical protein